MNWQAALDFLLDWARNTGVRILLSIVILFVSFKVTNIAAKKIEKTAEKHHSDKTVMRAVSYIFRIGIKVVIVICLVGYVGINTSGLTALIASLGVGIGLAVNGALSNLAGGVILIFTRPFRIDDYIEAQGYSGTVEDIHITNTRLRTPDNKIIFLPNGELSSGAIVNYSMQKVRRVDEVISVPCGADFNTVRDLLLEISSSHISVLKEPEPFARISERTPEAMKIVLRVWVESENYWTVKFDLLEQIKLRFDEAGIKMPPERISVKIEE